MPLNNFADQVKQLFEILYKHNVDIFNIYDGNTRLTNGMIVSRQNMIWHNTTKLFKLIINFNSFKVIYNEYEWFGYDIETVILALEFIYDIIKDEVLDEVIIDLYGIQ